MSFGPAGTASVCIRDEYWCFYVTVYYSNDVFPDGIGFEDAEVGTNCGSFPN